MSPRLRGIALVGAGWMGAPQAYRRLRRHYPEASPSAIEDLKDLHALDIATTMDAHRAHAARAASPDALRPLTDGRATDAGAAG